MSLALLFPLGLLALASLLVPLLVHLARRHHYAPLDFAALRWLQARVRPRQRIRFDEWPLLLVRLLLLAALALLLARPVLHGAPVSAPPWVVVAPGLKPLEVPAGSEGHWLAPGFPPLTDAVSVAAPPLASLLRELDQTLPVGTALTVYVPDPMPGLDGERPRLSREVEWKTVAVPAPSPEAPLASPVLRVADANTDATALRVVEALQRAWSNQPLEPALAADAVPGHGQIGVWLADAPLSATWQAWVKDGGTVLVPSKVQAPGTGRPVLRDAQGNVALTRHALEHGQILRFAAAVSPDALPLLREADFPRRLLEQMQPVAPPRLAAASTQQPLRGAVAPIAQPRDLSLWLLALIVLLFAVERALATAPRRGANA